MPSFRPPREPCEVGRNDVFRGRQMGEAAALLGKTVPISRVVHVRQPQHNGA